MIIDTHSFNNFRQINHHNHMIPILITLFASLASCSYIPQLLMTTSSQFLNEKLKQYGPTIIKQLNKQKIPDITYDDKVDGVHVKFNLTQINQSSQIHWTSNVLKVKDEYEFSVNSKNVNLTINGNIQFKIGTAIKQKGILVITITKLQCDTDLQFTQPKCSEGIGFDLQISQIFVHTDKIDIKIQGKTLDNALIKAIVSVLKSRLPSIINNIVVTTVNPLITNYTCTKIEEQFVLNNPYLIYLNTTEVPKFNGNNLYFPVDVNIKNMITNKTNDEIQNDNLPQKNPFSERSSVTAIISSNMINTVLWLIDDSQFLKLIVTNDSLGPNPPISLDTLSLSILFPGFQKKYPNKDVFLIIQPSNKFSSLQIRNGKLIAALGISVKFVANITGATKDPYKCIEEGNCVVGCDLNLTIPLSSALYLQSGPLAKGLVNSVQIQSIKVISSVFDIDLNPLTNIFNTLISSFRPQINKLLQAGYPLDISMLSKYEITDLLMSTKKDHLFLGVTVQ